MRMTQEGKDLKGTEIGTITPQDRDNTRAEQVQEHHKVLLLESK